MWSRGWGKLQQAQVRRCQTAAVHTDECICLERWELNDAKYELSGERLETF